MKLNNECDEIGGYSLSAEVERRTGAESSKVKVEWMRFTLYHTVTKDLFYWGLCNLFVKKL